MVETNSATHVISAIEARNKTQEARDAFNARVQHMQEKKVYPMFAKIQKATQNRKYSVIVRSRGLSACTIQYTMSNILFKKGYAYCSDSEYKVSYWGPFKMFVKISWKSNNSAI